MSRRATKALTEAQAKEALWRVPNLSWKLRGKQLDIYNHFKNTQDDISACLISRQFGKSFTLCLIAIEICIGKPKAVVKYICPTSKMVANIMVPRVMEIIGDCPADIRPEWFPSEKKWKFPNGSEIQVAGTDNQSYNSIRGGSSDLCIVDEAGFCDELETVVYNVLAPTTDTTGGKIFLASTPNDRIANHPFHELFIKPLSAAGKLLKFVLYDSPMVDTKTIERIIGRYAGGITNPSFRCEYLCEIPILTESSIVPEFAEMEETLVLKDENFPSPGPFSSFYVGLDPGMIDLTAMLLCYYNFEEACLYVMDEVIISKKEARTDVIASKLKDAERINFTFDGDHDPTTPMLRVMDLDLRLQADLLSLHDLLFTCTAKDNLAAAVNKMRVWISQGRVKIHERCKNLRYHLKYGQWNDQRTKFMHLDGTQDGAIPKSHVDTIPPLYYLIRNLYEHYNPKPANYDRIVTTSTHKRKNYEENTGTWNEIGKALTKFAKKRR